MNKEKTMPKILLIVDVQRDFCPGGSLAVPEGAAIIPTINRLAAEGGFDQVIATQDWHPEGHWSFAERWGLPPFTPCEAAGQMVWPRHCVQGSAGAELHPDLDQAAIGFILRKGRDRELDSYSAFLENDRRTPTGLFDLLAHGGELYLVGIATDVCVLNTALDALKGPFAGVHLVADACAAVSPTGGEQAIAHLRQAGVQITDSQSVLGAAASAGKGGQP